MPYAAGGSPSAWKTYSYDGLGRTLTSQLPDGASTTHYAYAGNQTTVTDPAGKWKTFTSDVPGNLVTVTEPDACVTANTYTTSYTYDWMKHLTGVSMPRANVSYTGTTCSEPGGLTTQTRTFVYDSAGRLYSATNPENGTVTYTYNSDNTLQNKHDAKGQDTVYTYDPLKRVTMVQRFPTGSTHAEDQCGREVYTYDTNPVNSTFSQYSYGRLTTAQYGCPVLEIIGGSWYGNTFPSSYVDMYSYHPAGGVTAKQTIYHAIFTDPTYGIQTTSSGSLEADYTYDSAGRMATLVNPAMPFWDIVYDPYGNAYYGDLCTLSYSYDAMGRPSGAHNVPTYGGCNYTWVQGVTYDFAGRMTAMQELNPWTVYSFLGASYSYESRSYNVNGQLSSMNGIQYVYSATQNNGQITQAIDGISGETISYQYDALKRLISAASSPTSGSTPTAWTQTYQYDGFGNLGPAGVNAATNRLAGPAYDANGNLLGGLAAMTYDVANRVTTASAIGGGIESYQYTPDNKRVLRTPPFNIYTPGEFTFYGGQGEKLGVFDVMAPDGSHPNLWFEAKGMTLWFAGRKVEDWAGAYGGGVDDTVPLVPDRLGSNRANGARYHPYGDEITSTGNNHTKFATYTRDGYTGQDYAEQRYYMPGWGRFNTPDPYQASGGPSDPGSWNRYSYVLGDPINLFDPWGQAACHQDDDCQKPRPTYAPAPIISISDMILTILPSIKTVAEYDDEHPTPQVLRAQCLKGVSQDVANLKKAVNAKIAEEFKPLPNILSLSGKEAVYMAIKGAQGALGEAITTDAALGAVAGAGIGAVIGAAAAVITLPLNGPIATLSTTIADGAIDMLGKAAQDNCSDASGLPVMLQ